MPSLIDRLKRVKSHREQVKAAAQSVVSESNEQVKPPEFVFYRQGTSDEEPQRIGSPEADYDKRFSQLQFQDEQGSAIAAITATTPERPPITPSTSYQSAAEGVMTTNGSPKSSDKRLSRRIISTLSRRPSQLSSRSRSSSYVPEFQPIDHSGDVEAQWEQRATMLARAGPPSPAIPRTDSIFDTGPPKLPPMDLGESTQTRPLADSLTPHLTLPISSSPSSSLLLHTTAASTAPALARAPSMTRRESTRLRRDRNTSNPSIIAEDGDFVPANGTRDDCLQSAIREHEKGNLELSAHLFKKAGQGDEGLPMGQLMYGLSLRHGWGVQKDEVRAIHWLRLAASSSAAVEESALSAGVAGGGQMKGDLVLAMYELGNCFRYGWGLDVDKPLARNYYETAANLGDGDAMSETAWCYETGFGTPKDKYKAAYWYRKSEKAGVVVPGMQWIWKPKYDENPFTMTRSEMKDKTKERRK